MEATNAQPLDPGNNPGIQDPISKKTTKNTNPRIHFLRPGEPSDFGRDRTVIKETSNKPVTSYRRVHQQHLPGAEEVESMDKARDQEKLFTNKMHMHISVHNSCSLQPTELKINIEIQEGSLYLTTNSVAMETLVLGMSNNYSVKIVNFFKRGALNHRGGLQWRYVLL